MYTVKKFTKYFKEKVRKPFAFWLSLICACIFVLDIAIGNLFYVPCHDVPSIDDIESIPYVTFSEQLINEEVYAVYLGSAQNYVYYSLKENKDLYYQTNHPGYDNFRLDVLEKGVIIENIGNMRTKESVESERNGPVMGIAFITGLGAMCLFFVSLSGSEETNLLISKSKKVMAGTSGTSQSGVSSTNDDSKDDVKTFDDVAGLKEVKRDMKCLVDFLVNKEKYTSAGAKLPKGVILYGPPGTGKTLIAKAIAGEADVPFLFMSGSDFIETYVGVGAKRVRELFATARKHAPCIIFIDEIDAIGGRRHESDNGEDRKTINAILTEMDGFNESENILVIAATNRLEDLDDALTRPGRFTDQFCVPLPETVADRIEIINIYAKNKKLDESVDIKMLAKEMIGFSPAKIEAVLNESAIISVQEGTGIITKEIIDKAMYKIMLHGHMKEDNTERSQEEIELVAWHEAGHALVGAIYGKDITKVTIISSTSGAGGVTFSSPKKTSLYSIEDIKHEIMELYAGRIGELLFYNKDYTKVTTGASNDIERATGLIHEYVTRYGMTDTFGMLKIDSSVLDKKQVMDMEISLAKELEKATIELMESRIDDLRQIAEELIEKETIYKSDIERIVKKKINESVKEDSIEINFEARAETQSYKCLFCHRQNKIDKRLLKNRMQFISCPACRHRNLIIKK